jgi:hypothetical protein
MVIVLWYAHEGGLTGPNKPLRRHGVRLLPHPHALSAVTPCFLEATGPILGKSSGSTGSAGRSYQSEPPPSLSPGPGQGSKESPSAATQGS